MNDRDFVYPTLCDEATFPLEEGGKFPHLGKMAFLTLELLGLEFLQMTLMRGCLSKRGLVDAADAQSQ